MSIDELAGRSLTALTDGLRPMPDPYGRAMIRYRRGLRRKRAALGAGVVATSMVIAAALLPPGERKPQPAEENSGWKNHLMWNQRLVDSPIRGTVGQDAAFVKEFGDRVLEHMQAGRYSRQWPVRQAKVLFLDDVHALPDATVRVPLDGRLPTRSWTPRFSTRRADIGWAVVLGSELTLGPYEATIFEAQADRPR